MQTRQHMAAVDLADAGNGDTFSVFQRGHGRGVFRNGFQKREELFHKKYLHK